MTHLYNFQVRRAEVVSPLGHTMGLIDRYHTDFRNVGELLSEQFRTKSLWGDVKKLIIAVDAVIVCSTDIVTHHARIHCLSFDAVHTQTAHLVFHQRNQWGHHNVQPIHRQRRNLEADRFASTCRHQSQRVLTLSDAFDDVFLNATKRVVAPVFLQQLPKGHHSPPLSLLISSICSCTSPCLCVFSSIV